MTKRQTTARHSFREIGAARPKRSSARTLLAGALLLVAGAAEAADCKASPEPERDWSGCNRGNIVLAGESLERANLVGTDFGLSDLRKTVLAGAKLEGAKLGRASLSGAVADGADFTGAEGYRTDLSAISAKGASFKSAELQRSSFAGAVLTGADFEKAELGRADFSGASLGDNAFNFANLARASFKGAKIAGPLDFSRAYMFLTRIEGADLTGATGLQQAQIDLTCGDAATKLPAGLRPPATWPCQFD